MRKREKLVRGQWQLSREEVYDFLESVRSDMSRENWRNADLLTTLQWALPEYARIVLNRKEK